MDIILTPYLGRDYKSRAAAIKAFRSNHSFILNQISHPFDGKPCGMESLKEAGIYKVKIRYDRLRKSVYVNF